MTRSADVLLASLIDYAGTFPPAKLTLRDAMAAYARDRADVDGWMLGRFVLASTALDEFEALAPAFLSASPSAWRLSVVGAQESMPDVGELARFNRAWHNRAEIAALEFAPMKPSEIGRVATQMPAGLDAYFEVPPGGDIEQSLQEIAAHGACAKIRTGGITANAFPDAMALIGFLEACHDARVAFKATAGLHHAMCGAYPLTYDTDSPRTQMYGFLNLGVAATLVHVGGGPADALDALRESSADAFTFSETGLLWRERRLRTEDLANARQRFFKGFGSCAFSEPLEELVRLGIVARTETPRRPGHIEVS
jgi:hypothetical protein